MRRSTSEHLDQQLAGLDPADPLYATEVVDRVLAAGRACGASDLHLQPTAAGLELKFRVDGVLRPVLVFPPEVVVNIITRLKVKAELLTYRTDSPQEGRIRSLGCDVEMRVSTFPTVHGEKAVVRLFGSSRQYQRLDDLGLHEDILQPLQRLLGETSGAILVSGPAGSGKTTTVYACLRELARQTGGARSLVSLEDPVEVAVAGVAQSQVNPAAGLDLATGLRFLMRQDPEVIMVGEIRDRPTAEAALQASLTGHLLLSTFHAGSAAETLSRLLEMGIEPYVLRSGLLAILCQRLVRRLCSCVRADDDPDARLGLPAERVMAPVGCHACGGTGYRGRFLLAEMLSFKTVPGDSGGRTNGSAGAELGRAVLARREKAVLERLAVEAGMVSRWQRAYRAIDAGLTGPAEVRRVLGFSETEPVPDAPDGIP
jgi:general secretion pathway protein E